MIKFDSKSANKFKGEKKVTKSALIKTIHPEKKYTSDFVRTI